MRLPVERLLGGAGDLAQIAGRDAAVALEGDIGWRQMRDSWQFLNSEHILPG